MPSGANLARQLAGRASIVVEAQPPGTLADFGLSLDELQRDNPALVMLSVSPFGQTGPLRDIACSDITLQH
jgi:crotonobetainyl-CoA:carnitine CoA-transferase CaiB-like acyl-CoA transferase